MTIAMTRLILVSMPSGTARLPERVNGTLGLFDDFVDRLAFSASRPAAASLPEGSNP
jgi:hypothetical protein